MNKAESFVTGQRLSTGWIVIGLHLLGLLAQLPLLVIYFRNLWIQPHYQFFPVVLLLVGFLFISRVSLSRVDQQVQSSMLGNIFLACALLILIVANYLFEPFAAAVGCLLLTASLFARIRDLETGGSLLPLSVLLLIIIRPPLSIDIRLITKLQSITSEFASALLDLFGVNHFLDGNKISLVDKQFFVEEACSGVQSLFTLLFLTLAFIVVMRKSVFRAAVLLLVSVFWAGFMNTVRVIAVVFAHDRFGANLADGLPHEILGYVVLIIAASMIVSFDLFLTFLFGKGDRGFDSSNVAAARIQSEQSSSGAQSGEGAGTATDGSLAPVDLVVAGVLCGILTLAALYPILRLGPGGVTGHMFKSFVVYEVEADAIPSEITVPLEVRGQKTEVTWKQTGFRKEKRERNSDWGTRSSFWEFQAGNARSSVSCDYPFTGWHDLSSCYRGNGWTIHKRLVLETEDPGKAPWKYVAMELQSPMGNYQYVFFSLFDEFGEPVEPIARSLVGQNAVERIIGAFRRRLKRNYGPYPQSYQIQNIFQSVRRIPEANFQELGRTHVIIRERLREHIIQDLHRRDLPSLAQRPGQ